MLVARCDAPRRNCEKNTLRRSGPGSVVRCPISTRFIEKSGVRLCGLPSLPVEVRSYAICSFSGYRVRFDLIMEHQPVRILDLHHLTTTNCKCSETLVTWQRWLYQVRGDRTRSTCVFVDTHSIAIERSSELYKWRMNRGHCVDACTRLATSGWPRALHMRPVRLRIRRFAERLRGS